MYEDAPVAQEIALVGVAPVGGVVAVPVKGDVSTRAVAVLVRHVPPPQPLAPLAAKLVMVKRALAPEVELLADSVGGTELLVMLLDAADVALPLDVTEKL